MTNPLSILQKASEGATSNKMFQDAKKKYNSIYSKKSKDLSVSDVLNLDRPAPTWRWLCTLPAMDGIIIDPIRCENVEVPFTSTLATQDKYREGMHRNIVSGASYDTVSAEFYETEDYKTTAYFLAWKKRIFDEDKKTYGVPGQYLQFISFRLLPVVESTSGGNYVDLAFEECYPNSIAKVRYGGETGKVKIKVDFIVHSMSFKPSADFSKPVAKKPGAFSDAATLLNKALKWKS